MSSATSKPEVQSITDITPTEHKRWGNGSIQQQVIETVLQFFSPGQVFTDDDVRYLLPDLPGEGINRALHQWAGRTFGLKKIRRLARGHNLLTTGRSASRRWWLAEPKPAVSPEVPQAVPAPEAPQQPEPASAPVEGTDYPCRVVLVLGDSIQLVRIGGRLYKTVEVESL